MSSSTPSSEAVLPPRASLDSLPTELKKRIVELCAEQDERYKEYKRCFDGMMEHYAELDSANELDALVQAQHERSRRSTVGTLFCLSTQWSELAAPLRFQTVKSSKTVDPIFRFVIGRRRARHFTRLELDNAATAADLAAFLPLLPDFVNVRALTLEQLAVDAALGVGACKPLYSAWVNPAAVFAVDVLLPLFAKITSLHLNATRDDQAVDMIQRSASLRHLVLDVYGMSKPAEVVQKALETVTALETLEIRTPLSVSLPTLNLSTASAPLAPPTLTSFTYQGYMPPTSLYALMPSFSPFLRTLELVTTRDELGRPFAAFSSPFFPCLRVLKLSGHYENFRSLLSCITFSAFPALVTLRLDTVGFLTVTDASMEVFSVLARHKQSPASQFRHFHLCDLRTPLNSEERAFLENWAAQHHLDVCSEPIEPFPSICLLRDEPTYEVSTVDLVASVDRAAEFLASWHAQARQAPTREEYARLAAVLRAAELARVAAET